VEKGPDAFRTISEVAEDLGLPQHVLRFWETRFGQIKPLKRGGGRRYYRPDDVDLLRGIRHLLYGEGYTIRGVQQILREQGVRHVQSIGMAVEAEDAGKVAPSAPVLAESTRISEEPMEDEHVGEARGRSSLADLLPTLRASKPVPELPRVVEVPVPQPLPEKSSGEDMPPFPFRRSAAPKPAEAPVRAMPEKRMPEPARPMTAAAKEPLSTPVGRLGPEAIRLLKSTLYELAECQRTLEAARLKSS
jgi:DNA-binding transcriptional MerR regulator